MSKFDKLICILNIIGVTAFFICLRITDKQLDSLDKRIVKIEQYCETKYKSNMG